MLNNQLISRLNFMFTTFVVLILFSNLNAQDLHIQVLDKQQKPIQSAVLYIKHSSLDKPKQITDTKIVNQLDKEFIPYVTAIQKGDAIHFPNADNIRHQVYSFSQAKQFEIPLYKANTNNLSSTITFDQTGVVAAACNIHDWMITYIYVVATDKYSVSDQQGKAIISNLIPGQYEILIWHPKLNGSPESYQQSISIVDNVPATLTFEIDQKTVLQAWRAPRNSGSRNY
ncbi:MAG: methylamine utilization protein [Saccharospirillaceae bacterium]|nr:hypothetical protein [Pseudomonadales bacterium]NRB79963.1 methylamine utilization protein [Saccharospirillaceae bacterium]